MTFKPGDLVHPAGNPGTKGVIVILFKYEGLGPSHPHYGETRAKVFWFDTRVTFPAWFQHLEKVEK